MSVSIEEQILVAHAIVETLESIARGSESQYYEAAARIEKYETAMHDAIGLFKHSTHTRDRDRAIAVLEKALKGTRYDQEEIWPQ